MAVSRYTVDDLSRGFFKSVLDGSYSTDEMPILQILEARPITKGDQTSKLETRFRFRISDGTFFYSWVFFQFDVLTKDEWNFKMSLSKANVSACLNQSQVATKIHEDKLYVGTPIIRLDRYNFGQPNPTSGNRPLIIIDYTLVSKDDPVLGNPVSHTGNPKDYHGLNTNALCQGTNGSNDEVNHRSGRDSLKSSDNNHSTLLAKHNRLGVLSQNVTPIKLITPWRIVGIVTAKEDMREIRTAARGEMKVFNFELTDDQGGCIRIAAFNETAEKYYAVVQKGMMYYVSGGTVKQANKRYNTTGHDYEISLRNDSEVVPCTDREKIVRPKMALSVTPLSHIASRANECVDVLAVIDKVNDIQQVTQRSTGESLDKRDLELIDQSGVVAVLTVWGEYARNIEKTCEHQTIGIKGALVREFNGSYSLSLMKSSRAELNMECDETAKLYAWYKEKRPHIEVTTMSKTMGGDYTRSLRTIGVATALSFGKDEERGVIFYITGFISQLKSDGALYKSCGTNGCKKKVIDIDNQYRCEKCNLTLSSFKYVLLLSIEVCDFTGSHWVTLFEEQASKLLSKGADELGHLMDANQIEEYNDAFNAVRFRQFVFKIRSKNEFFNDSERIKWTVMSVEPVNYEKHNQELKKTLEVLEAA
uniref:Replication protein A subunit n=1 Tax=Syphacia muris TaxID=451379 RepID=A0A0N5ARY3_9BILA